VSFPYARPGDVVVAPLFGDHGPLVEWTITEPTPAGGWAWATHCGQEHVVRSWHVAAADVRPDIEVVW
jgi:hypothetical protein